MVLGERGASKRRLARRLVYRRHLEWNFPGHLTVSGHLHRVTGPVGCTCLFQPLDDVYGVRSRGEIIRQHHSLLVIEAVTVSDGEAVARHLCRPCALLAPERGLRLPEEFTARVDAWAADHGGVTRSEAIRQLVEHALASTPTKGRSQEARPKALELERVAIERTRSPKSTATAVVAQTPTPTHLRLVKPQLERELPHSPSEFPKSA
jgi:Arc/MetJ-type ribon-helix-helix transcriptional regulator